MATLSSVAAHLQFPRPLPKSNGLGGFEGDSVDLGEDFEGQQFFEGLESFFAGSRCKGRHAELEPEAVENVSPWEAIPRWDREFERDEMRHPDFDLLDEMIAKGWGDTPQKRIPPDWRKRKGPDKSFTPEHKHAVSVSLKEKHAARRNQIPLYEKQIVNPNFGKGER